MIITTAAILTDSIFECYGGDLSSSSPEQRQAAYAIAEGQAAEVLNTFISPTTITGTHSWPPMNQPLQLPYTHLNSVASVTAIHDGGVIAQTTRWK